MSDSVLFEREMETTPLSWDLDAPKEVMGSWSHAHLDVLKVPPGTKVKVIVQQIGEVDE